MVARYTVEDMIQCRAARKLQMTEQVLGSNDDSSKFDCVGPNIQAIYMNIAFHRLASGATVRGGRISVV